MRFKPVKPYILKTNRLGLRNWLPSDEIPFTELCQDPAVMEHFPSTLSAAETSGLIKTLDAHFKEFGYTYFAVDVLETGKFIGFAGFKNQTWESEYTPCVDIGYRLEQSAWGKGYATEAATALIQNAFSMFGIKELYSFTTNTNMASEHVMKKIGMQYVGTVQHPSIAGDDRFKHCVVYKLIL